MYNVTGHPSGSGVEEGYERVVLKSHHGKYLGATKYNNLFARFLEPSKINKFTPVPQGGKVVTFKTDRNKYIKCDF